MLVLLIPGTHAIGLSRKEGESLLYLVFKVRSAEMSISCSFSVTGRSCFNTLSSPMDGLLSHVRGADCYGKYSCKLSFNCCKRRIMHSRTVSQLQGGFVQECMAIWQTLGLSFLYIANPELNLKKKGFNSVLNIQNVDSRTL